jgi:regulator of protease activity HflC (stomatin/prohibitin superfamily)
MAKQAWQTKLHQSLTERLDQDAVHLLCFDLAIDYNHLGGPSKSDKVTALIEFCQQHRLIGQLLSTFQSQHPDVTVDLPDADISDQQRRAQVEFCVESDIISFGNQHRAGLIERLAELFDIESDEIHVLTEASTGAQVRLLLGMSETSARKLVFPASIDSRFDALHKEFHVREINLVTTQLGHWEKLSFWKSHRFRGMLRLVLYLGGLGLLLLAGLILTLQPSPQGILSRLLQSLPQGNARALLGRAFQNDFRASLSLFVYALVGALPGVLAWGGLLYILTKFMGTLYKLGDLRQTFEYVFLSVFGPLFFRYPFVFVQEGKVESRSQRLPQGNPDGPGGPCLFIVFNDNAIVLERAGRRIGVVGPTVYTARRFEKIYQVLDLRPQTRNVTATLITRDGIPVKAKIGATFRIRWRGEPTAKWPYPADPDALLQAAASQGVYQLGQGKEVRTWADRVGGNLDVVLRSIIARYRLDELLEPHDPGIRPRSDLMRNLTEALRNMAAGFGAEILEVRLEPLEFDTDLPIKQQWMDTWRALWEGQVRVREAQAEASAIRMREMAHAYAQLEMIAAITREFQATPDTKSIPIDLIVLRFVEVISRMAANPESAIFLPHEALQTLEGVRKMLDEARKPQPSLGSPAGTEPHTE